MTDTLAQMRGARVLIVGDLMLDEYVSGTVQRISPEAPVPVVEYGRSESRLGGAANAAANVQALGGEVTLIGVVGTDAAAGELGSALARVGVTAHLCTDAARPTTKKTRVVAQQQQIVRIDYESKSPIDGATHAEVLAAIEADLALTQALVLSDYAKGVLTPEVARAAIGMARGRRIPVVVDPKGHDFSIYRGATLITPNLHELERAAALPTRNLAEITTAALRLLANLADTSLLVTRGAEGMTLFDARGPRHHVPATAREVYDVTGAGDTVVATVALALAADVDLPLAMEIASLAAGIAVSRRGTTTVSAAELAEALAPLREAM